MFSSADLTCLTLAFEEATKAVGFTSPNPAVGSIIVQKGRVIGHGRTQQAGSHHAELMALRSMRQKKGSKGATLYTTLEPCCHYGRTPPCTDAIIQAGIARVVVGMRDPYKKVKGKGIKELQRHGIHVDVLDPQISLLQDIRMINQPFLKWVKTGLPYVTLKVAVSLDGKIATRTGDSKWMTGAVARADARMIRSQHNAVLVGAGTVRADDPNLGIKGKWKQKKLLRIIIDPDLSLHINFRVFRDRDVFVACTDRASRSRQKRYEQNGTSFQSFGKTRVSIPQLLQFLAVRGIQSLFVEGGGSVHGSFYDAALRDTAIIDQILFYIAPKIIGGEDASNSIRGKGTGFIRDAIRLHDVEYQKIGQDMRVRGLVHVY